MKDDQEKALKVIFLCNWFDNGHYDAELINHFKHEGS